MSESCPFCYGAGTLEQPPLLEGKQKKQIKQSTTLLCLDLKCNEVICSLCSAIIKEDNRQKHKEAKHSNEKVGYRRKDPLRKVIVEDEFIESDLQEKEFQTIKHDLQ